MSKGLLNYAVAAAVGLAFSTAHALGIAVAVLMPALVLSQSARSNAYGTAVCYYAGALWPLIVGASNFFGSGVSVLSALLLWSVACILLALPWAGFWSAKVGQWWWRAPLGLAMSAIPPLGIIGWASPIMAAGFLFPGTRWWGLIACAIAPGLVATRPRYVAPLVVIAAVACNLLRPPVSSPPADWKAINTRFGGIAHGTTNPMPEYAAAQSIQRAALSTNATVLLFPETVIPTWTAATDEFWRPTIQRLRTDGRIIIVGARLPVAGRMPLAPSMSDYVAAMNVLRGGSVHFRRRTISAVFQYDNAAVIRGAETAIFRQRVPVPLAMWSPFGQGGARLHLFGPGIIHVGSRRAAVLVCYEQLIVWPIVASLYEQPDILLGLANDHWAAGTVILALQKASMRAWARLFALPYLFALNS